MEKDSEIIERVKKGNKEAYGVIVKKYMRKAYSLALGFVGNTHDALDLSQTAFIKAYRSLPAFDQNRPFLPWFYAILRNLCINHMRRKKTIPMIPLETETQADPGHELRREKHQKDMQELVARAISLLPHSEREVVLLKYFQGHTYKEIGEMMSCPLGTVMSRLYYARRKLRDYLEKYLE